MGEDVSYKRYPGAELLEAVEAVKELIGKLGSAGVHTAPDLAVALGLSPRGGATSRKIGAMTSYGLLARSSHGYVVTPIAKQINRPLPNELPDLLKRAFLSADLFAKVHAEFEEEGRLPEALDIVLERKFGVHSNTASFAERILRKSGEQAGVYDSAGNYLTAKAEAIAEEPGASRPPETIVEAVEVRASTDSKLITDVMMTLELPSPRMIIHVKREITGAELKKLQDWLEKIVKPQLEFLQIEGEASTPNDSNVGGLSKPGGGP